MVAQEGKRWIVDASQCLAKEIHLNLDPPNKKIYSALPVCKNIQTSFFNHQNFSTP